MNNCPKWVKAPAALLLGLGTLAACDLPYDASRDIAVNYQPVGEKQVAQISEATRAAALGTLVKVADAIEEGDGSISGGADDKLGNAYTPPTEIKLSPDKTTGLPDVQVKSVLPEMIEKGECAGATSDVELTLDGLQGTDNKCQTGVEVKIGSTKPDGSGAITIGFHNENLPPPSVLSIDNARKYVSDTSTLPWYLSSTMLLVDAYPTAGQSNEPVLTTVNYRIRRRDDGWEIKYYDGYGVRMDGPQDIEDSVNDIKKLLAP